MCVYYILSFSALFIPIIALNNSLYYLCPKSIFHCLLVVHRHYEIYISLIETLYSVHIFQTSIFDITEKNLKMCSAAHLQVIVNFSDN